MKCVVPFGNIKILARGVHALSKIGNELLMEVREEGLIFRSINVNRSAMAEFHFKHDFFSLYHTKDNVESQGDANSCEKFMLSMKSAVWAFRSVAVIDRVVDRLVIETLEDNEDYLKILMHCKADVDKTYLLPLLESDPIKVNFDPSSTSGSFELSSRAAWDALQTFLAREEEVTMNISKDKFVMRNYVDSHSSNVVNVHSALSMWPDEFVKYDTSSEVDITFCLMEMRAIVAFANAFALNLKADFTTAGEPLLLSVELEHMLLASVLLSTMSPDDAGSQFTSQPLSQTTDTLRIDQSVNDEERDTENNNTHANTDMSTQLMDVAVNQTSVALPPPSKRVRYFFERCFNSTLNPMANVNRILAPDSDPEDSGN